LTKVNESDRMCSMKTTNIFYPTAMVWLYNSFLNKKDNRLYEFIVYASLGFTFSFFFPYSILLLIVWYISDVIGNILDWIGMKVFVNFPLWGLTKADELIKKADELENKKTKKTKTEAEAIVLEVRNREDLITLEKAMVILDSIGYEIVKKLV
jgi:hypothetical protein